MKFIRKDQNLAKLIVRIAVGALMLMYGIFKLFVDNTAVENMLLEVGLPKILALGVYVGEILAPVLIIVGFRTRAAALILFFNCVVAILLGHMHEIFSINQYGGWSIDLIALYTLGALSLVFSGGGRYALSTSHHLD